MSLKCKRGPCCQDRRSSSLSEFGCSLVWPRITRHGLRFGQFRRKDEEEIDVLIGCDRGMS